MCILIVAQFALYFLIFIVNFHYSKVCGLNKNIGIILFTVFAILGRVNNWELFILPMLVIIMLICAIKNKNLSKKGNSMLSEIQKE